VRPLIALLLLALPCPADEVRVTVTRTPPPAVVTYQAAPEVRYYVPATPARAVYLAPAVTYYAAPATVYYRPVYAVPPARFPVARWVLRGY
jgi:hypothetical protein